jgi:molybdopterin-binding protein
VRVQNEELRAEMRVQNEQLRAEMRVQNEQLRTEMQAMVAGMYKWMLATILAIIIVGIGLGNIVISRITVPSAARTSMSAGAGAAPATSIHARYPFPVQLVA